MKTFFVLLSFFLPLSSFAQIQWVTPILFDADAFDGCDQVVQYIETMDSEVQEIVDQGLSKISATFYFWEIDVNQDLLSDYFVSVASGMTCGTGGCSAELFLSEVDQCVQKHSPHLHVNSQIGIEGSRLFLNKPFPFEFQPGQSDEYLCGVWNIEEGELTHIENIAGC